MRNADDHRWNLHESDEGYLPECDDAFEQKMDEWQEVREKGKVGSVPLCDVEVTPKTNSNFWPVEYVVWFANPESVIDFEHRIAGVVIGSSLLASARDTNRRCLRIRAEHDGKEFARPWAAG